MLALQRGVLNHVTLSRKRPIGLFQLTSRSVSRDPLVGRNTTFAISFVLQTHGLLPWFFVHSTEFAIESNI